MLHGLVRLPALGFGSAFCALLLLVWGHRGEPSVTWMNMLDLDTFHSPGDVWAYLAALRTGIPPVLSTLELLWWVEFHNLELFSYVLYPVSIAFAFTLAVLIQPRRPILVIAVLLLALLLASQGVKVHARNPALYDPIFGALLLGYFALLGGWLRARRVIWLTAAGLTLAMLELTRPFMIYVLPVFLLIEIHRILRTALQPWPALIAFVLPVILLSGSWHLHLYLTHDGQIAWTSISGYNLQNAWADFDPEIRGAQHIIQPPRDNGLWDDLNRTDVYRDSERVKKLILAKISNDPARAVGYAINRVVAFGASPTRIYKHNPQGVGITLYRATAITLNLLVTMYVVVGALTFLYQHRWPWLSLRWWLGASVLLIAILMAMAEKAEEARFLFSILPVLLAAAGFAIYDVVRWSRAAMVCRAQ